MAPRLDFAPALSSTTHVPLTHGVSTTLPLRIKVQLSRVSYDKLRDAGRQVQVWSDMHVTRRGEHQWKETPFLLPESPRSYNESSVNTISLLTTDEEAQSLLPVNDGKDVTLVASLTVPNAQDRFSFTFRLAGPYSQVEWLGNMGSNGVFVVGRGGHRVGLESAAASWNAADGKWEGTSREGELVEVARIDNVKMQGYAFASNGSRNEIKTSEDITSNLLLLTPEASQTNLINPPTSLVIASPAPVTLTAAGKLLVAPTADPIQVIIKELGSLTTFEDVKNLVDLATSGAFELISMSPKTPGFLVLKRSSLEDACNPAHLFVVPRTTISTPIRSRISLNIETLLMNTFPSPSATYVIHNETARDILFINQNDINSFQPEIGIITGPNGGELVLIPAIEVLESFDDGQWKIAALSSSVLDVQRITVMPAAESIFPSFEVPASTVEEHPPSTLPSPPPSLPAQSEGSRTPAHDHVDLAEEKSAVSINDIGRGPNPRLIDTALTVGRPRLGLFSSVRQALNSFLLTWWLRAFGLLRLLLLLTVGHRYRGLEYHLGPQRKEEAPQQSSQEHLMDTTKATGVPETTVAEIEEVITISAIAEPQMAHEEVKLESSTKEERPGSTNILTPPLTPPTHTWSLDTVALSTSAPIQNQLQLTLRSREDKLVKLIAFCQDSVSLPKHFEVLVNDIPVRAEEFKSRTGYWLIQSQVAGDATDYQINISISA